MQTRTEIKRALQKAAEQTKNQYPEVLFGDLHLYELPSGLFMVRGQASAKAYTEPPFVEEYSGTFTSKLKALEYVDDIHCGRPDKIVLLVLEETTVRPTRYINYGKGIRQAEEILRAENED